MKFQSSDGRDLTRPFFATGVSSRAADAFLDFSTSPSPLPRPLVGGALVGVAIVPAVTIIIIIIILRIVLITS